MLHWLKRRSALNHKAGDLYGKVVTAARNPWFYGPGRVSDTPEGRFEVVAVHLFLVAERVRIIVSDGPALAQALIEAFVADMDDCMREMGVGDLTVPKRVKRAAAVFYERADSYRKALSGIPPSGAADPVAVLVAQTILDTTVEDAFTASLTAYIRASQDSLARLNDDDAKSGTWAFAGVPVKAGSTQ